MLKAALFVIVFVTTGYAQDCIKYNVATTIKGTLALRDESSYNQFVVIRPVRPICTVADPNDVTSAMKEYYRKRDDVTEIQAGVYGSDSASAILRDRVKKLVGHPVLVKGDLFPAFTGYHRTAIQLRLAAVEPLNNEGEQALRVSTVPFKPKNVESYDVTVHAGARLIVEAYETGSEMPLTPAEEYAPHWMTGGEVEYVGCRDGYQRKVISTTTKNGGICGDSGLCGLVAFPKTPIKIEFRCTKKL